MKRTGSFLVRCGWVALLAAMAGCASDDTPVQPPPPAWPVSVAEHDALVQAGTRFPRQTIVLLNRQRAMDADRDEDQRVESLALAASLAGDDPAVAQDIRTLLGLPDTPPILRAAALRQMLAKNPTVAKTFAVFAANGYAFHARDVHLLTSLAGDEARQPLTRPQLVADIHTRLSGRAHVPIASPAPETSAPAGATPAAEAEGIDGFDKNLGRLTHADLWNILLVQEMLARPDVLRGLNNAVRDDRADTATAWGGLIRYVNGRAEMVRYKAPAEAGQSDFRHAFNAAAVEAGTDALARFQFHFEHPDNVLRAGPTASDLADAATHNAYGIIVTSIRNDTACCVHYYNPQGVIVSLGVYSLAEWK